MPKILNIKLYEHVKLKANKIYKKSSAYKSGWIGKTYTSRGEQYGDDNKPKQTKIWFEKKWEDIGGKAYPVVRPTKIIGNKTLLTANEIDPKQLQKQYFLKQIIKGKSHLPPFKKYLNYINT